MDDTNKIMGRQEAIAEGESSLLGLPKFNKYTIGNLRGGVGKTTLSFNLAYLTDEMLAVDTCPQGNLSYFFDNKYYTNSNVTVRDVVLPYLIPGLGKSAYASLFIGATNEYFKNKKSFYIPSSAELYLLPSQLITAINQAKALMSPQREQVISSIIYSLRTELDKELERNNLNRCLIDTSPFLPGGTQLAWYATDALIIPVRTDQQSVNSLQLLIETLKTPSSEFRKYLGSDEHIPKIQMVILTHCGWSTTAGAKNQPNQQTKVYLKKVYEVLNMNRNLLTTDDPANHICMLDDFLGSGRISSALSKPLELLQRGETKSIDRVRVSVNVSVDKCKNQLKFISENIW